MLKVNDVFPTVVSYRVGVNPRTGKLSFCSLTCDGSWQDPIELEGKLSVSFFSNKIKIYDNGQYTYWHLKSDELQEYRGQRYAGIFMISTDGAGKMPATFHLYASSEQRAIDMFNIVHPEFCASEVRAELVQGYPCTPWNFDNFISDRDYCAALDKRNSLPIE